MARKAMKVTIHNKLSAEGLAMDKLFRDATSKAMAEAFKNRKTLLVERDGWLMRVYEDGRIWRKLKKLEPLQLERVA